MSLDRFTRFQDKSLGWIYVFLILGVPAVGAVLGAFVVDKLLPTSLHILLHMIAWGGGLVLGCGLGFIIAFTLSSLAERGVDGMRQLYGFKPLSEVLRQAIDEEEKAADARADARRRWFTNLDEKEALYELYSLLRTQGEQLESFIKLFTFMRALGLIGLIILALLGLGVWLH